MWQNKSTDFNKKFNEKLVKPRKKSSICYFCPYNSCFCLLLLLLRYGIIYM